MEIELYHGDRSALLPLFELADDSAAQVAGYMALGEVLVARDRDAIVGQALIVETGEAAVFELKSMAVRADRQGEGIGRSLVAKAIERCRERKGRQIIVSTAAAGTGILRFYQRLGFRMSRIVRDAFGPAQGYGEGILLDGIPLRDQVFLDLDL
jgi:ribosomal protein S18 acetylase RimI-like enzyme